MELPAVPGITYAETGSDATRHPEPQTRPFPAHPSHHLGRVVDMLRRRFVQSVSLQDRLAAFAEEARAKAVLMPPGPERDELLKKIRRVDIASHLDDWANSSGLRPPN
jgi:hypothetical protein